MQVLKQSKFTVEKMSYENALRRIHEQGQGFEYMSAYRFHNKKFVDESGNIQCITFSDEERLQCLIEKIEHVSIVLSRLSDSEDIICMDSYENYNAQLKEYKKALFELFEEVKKY